MARGNGLSDAYTETLNRVKQQEGNKSVLGLKVLMWVLNSQRPLRADELRHALGVGIRSTSLSWGNVPALQTLLSSCLGLVTVEASSSTLRLVHFTLQEHLMSNPELFDSPHSTIAEVCLTYLNFGIVRGFWPALRSAPTIMPFLEYASCYWEKHTRIGVTENVKILALKLLDRFDDHVSAQILLLCNCRESLLGSSYYWAEGPIGFTGLHGAAFLGIVEIFTAILEMKKWDVNAADCMGGTALTWAAVRGQEGVVKMLLEREEVNPDQVDTEYGRTPLSWAAGSGQEGVAKMLLKREDVIPDQADTKYGRTPLSWAAMSGHGGLVKILLGREDVNPNHEETLYRRTPLLWAAEKGYEGIVKILLERDDINPDKADTRYGQTPLYLATERGHDRIVRVLLERKDVNPNHECTFCHRTPLLWAAEKGVEGIVKMLLEREDVNPDKADTRYSQTPLSLAAEHGHDEIAKMLLERKDVNPNQADTKYGQTPLSLAAESGHDEIVKMLLERKDINPNQAVTKNSKTPLLWAPKTGHEEVLKILLERMDTNPHRAAGFCGRTPLSLAAENGHANAVKMLLEWNDVPLAVPDSGSQTPPWLPLPERYGGLVRTLLDPDNANSDKVDHGGPASLLPSPGHGDGSVVEMQLKSHDPNTDITYFNSQPPLPAADFDEREPVVDLMNSAPMSPDNNLPGIEPSMLPQPSSMWPLQLPYSPRKSDTHPKNTGSALPVVINWYWVLGSFVCLLSFLAYSKNSYN